MITGIQDILRYNCEKIQLNEATKIPHTFYKGEMITSLHH